MTPLLTISVTRKTGTFWCMSGSKLWLAECLPYHCDVVTNQIRIEPE